MAQQRRKKRSLGRKRNRQKTRRRLWLLLTLSVLFLMCILYDCHRKGLFQQEWQEITHQTPEKKDSGETKEDQEKIRVLLTNDAMNSIYHDAVQISGTKDLVVVQNGKKKHYAKGKILTVTAGGGHKLKGKLDISCPQGKIKVVSITRSGKIPAYRGTMKLVMELCQVKCRPHTLWRH